MTSTLPQVAEGSQDPRAQAPMPPLPSGLSGRQIALVGLVVAVSLVAGHELATALVPAIQAKKLSWVLGRGLGIASFLSLSALVAFGTPPSTLAVHASLGAATLTLVAAHLTALALDPWAKIGWLGALVPWVSSYRPTPVALGVIALWGILLVGGTARMAGKLGRKRWLRVHRLAWVVWTSALLHGLTTGSDTMALRYVYAASAAVIVALWVTARLVPAPKRTRAAPTSSGTAG